MGPAKSAAKPGRNADAYAKEVVQADFEQAGDNDVFRKVRTDFDAAGVDLSDSQIRSMMDELLAAAALQRDCQEFCAVGRRTSISALRWRRQDWRRQC